MNVQRTLAFVLGGVAAGGAIVYGVARLAGQNDNATTRGKRRGDVLLVRVTENGKKYHRDTCPLLHGETRVIEVTEALRSYEPCKACHPPGDVEVEELLAFVDAAPVTTKVVDVDVRADSDLIGTERGVSEPT